MAILIFLNLWWGYILIAFENIIDNAVSAPNIPNILAWPTLDMLRTLTLAYSLAKSSNTSLFYNYVLNISYYLLNTILKVKNRMVVWIQNGGKCVGDLPSCSTGWPAAETRCSGPQWVSYCMSLAWDRSEFNNSPECP